jgi:hypothetical protein
MNHDVLRVYRRTWALAFAAVAAGVLFAPFLLAGSDPPGISLARLIVYMGLGAGLLTALAAHFGLRWADRASLPMPLLRSWEYRQPVPWRHVGRVAGLSIAAGISAGAACVLLAHVVGFPANPGGLLVRIATTPFGGIVTEVIAHLFLMSGLVLAFRRRTIPAVLVSALVFAVLFHGGAAAGITASVRYTALALNAGMAILTGFMYSSQGFEAAVLTHASAHAIALAVN